MHSTFDRILIRLSSFRAVLLPTVCRGKQSPEKILRRLLFEWVRCCRCWRQRREMKTNMRISVRLAADFESSTFFLLLECEVLFPGSVWRKLHSPIYSYSADDISSRRCCCCCRMAFFRARMPVWISCFFFSPLVVILPAFVHGIVHASNRNR